MLDASTLLHPGAHGWGAGRRTHLGGARFRHLRVARPLALGGPRQPRGRSCPPISTCSTLPVALSAPVQPSPQDPPGTVPPTRLDWLDSLRGAPWHWSMAAEGHLQMFHRATLGVSYEDGETLSGAFGTYYPRSVMVFLRLDPVAQDASGNGSGLYLAYHLRNVDALAEAGWRAFLYVAARHDINRYVALQAAVRRGLQTQTQQVETDVMGSLSVQFDL